MFAIRELLVSVLGDEIYNYKDQIPQHIQDNVQRRISLDLKKKPSANQEDYLSFTKRIEFFDLNEYQETIISKINWEKFSKIFIDKNGLSIRFSQLSNLRNGIRHSRSISEIEQLDGEVAIKWFKTVMK